MNFWSPTIQPVGQIKPTRCHLFSRGVCVPVVVSHLSLNEENGLSWQSRSLLRLLPLCRLPTAGEGAFVEHSAACLRLGGGRCCCCCLVTAAAVSEMVCLSGSSSVLKESLSKLRGRPPTQFVHIQTDKVELTFLIVHGCWSVGEVVFFGLLDENGGTHFPRVSLVSNYSILNASNATAFGHKLLLSLSFTDYSIFQYIKRHMYISIGYIYLYLSSVRIEMMPHWMIAKINVLSNGVHCE